jgi:hypothetical protein
VVLVPAATAPLKSPVAVAVVPGPIPTATLVRVLVQPAPALMPLMDAQVALAVPAEPSAAAANPDATALSTSPPASRSVEIALYLLIGLSPSAGIMWPRSQGLLMDTQTRLIPFNPHHPPASAGDTSRSP